MTTSMRAKMRITGLVPYPFDDTPVVQETLTFSGVAKSGPYPSDGSDEDNSYAKFSPSAALQLTIANPALLGKFKIDDTFYVDFSPVVADEANETISLDPNMVLPATKVLTGALNKTLQQTLVVGRRITGEMYVAGTHGYDEIKKLFADGLAELERLGATWTENDGE